MIILVSFWKGLWITVGVLVLLAIIAFIIMIVHTVKNYPKMKIYNNGRFMRDGYVIEKDFINLLEDMLKEEKIEVTFYKSLLIVHPIGLLLTNHSWNPGGEKTLIGGTINGDRSNLSDIYFTISESTSDTVTFKYWLMHYNEISDVDHQKISSRKWWKLKVIDNNTETTKCTINRTKLPERTNLSPIN